MSSGVLQLHALAWTVREEALQHLCSAAQKKNCVVTQGGIWISLSSLQPFAIQDGSTEKKAWGCDSHPCLAADVCREEPWLSSLPLCPSHLCVQRAQQDRVGTQALLLQLTAQGISAPHNDERWTAEGTYTLTCHHCICQSTPVSLLQETETWQHSPPPLQARKQTHVHFLLQSNFLSAKVGHGRKTLTSAFRYGLRQAQYSTWRTCTAL